MARIVSSAGGGADAHHHLRGGVQEDQGGHRRQRRQRGDPEVHDAGGHAQQPQADHQGEPGARRTSRLVSPKQSSR
eukprot:3432738-Pyramimonas_sp.AAC.1